MSEKHNKPYWTERFEIIKKAGGSTLPNAKALTSKERRKISFSFLGFFLNIFYYFYLGMWKRGFYLLGLCTVPNALIVLFLLFYPENSIAIQLDKLAFIIAPVIFGSFVVKDFYSFKVEQSSEGKTSDLVIGLGVIALSLITVVVASAYVSGEFSDQVQENVEESRSESSWILTESTDKLTAESITRATQNYVPEEMAQLLLQNQLTCVRGTEEAYVELSVTTFENAILDGKPYIPVGMQFEFDDGAAQTLSLFGLAPSKYLQQQSLGAVFVKVRVDEDKLAAPSLRNGIALISALNNMVFFPFHFEKSAKQNFDQLRIEIPTTQGATSILIDVNDPSVAKVYAACSSARYTSKEGVVETPDSGTQSIAPAQADTQIETNADPYAEQEELNIPDEEYAPIESQEQKGKITGSSESDQRILPSFDCAKASNFTEKTLCSDNELASLDLQLTKLYREKRASSTDLDLLKSEQVNWIKSSRKCTDKQCIKEAYLSRIAMLSN